MTTALTHEIEVFVDTEYQDEFSNPKGGYSYSHTTYVFKTTANTLCSFCKGIGIYTIAAVFIAKLTAKV